MKNTQGVKAVPENDNSRVEALRRYRILDTPPEESFNNVARLATQFFNVPIAIITFVDTDRVFLKANIGVNAEINNPRTTSLCTLVMLNDEVTIFEDITNMDPCLIGDPILIAELGFKFYAGAPIKTPDGFSIGTIGLIGLEPRSFSAKEAEMLTGLSKIVMDEIELRLRGILEAEQRLLDIADQAQYNFNSYTFLAKAPVAIGVLKGRDLRIEMANAKILEVWDKTDDIIGETLISVLPEIKPQGFLQILDDVFTSGKAFYGYETRVSLVRNGTMEDVYFNFVYQPLKDTDGNTINIMIVATEITEQVKSRKLLEENEDGHQSTNQILIETIQHQAANNKGVVNVGTWDINVKTGDCENSAEFRQLFGYYANEEMKFSQAMAQVVLEYRDKVMEAIDATINTGQAYRIEYPVVGFHDQKIRWLRAIGKVAVDINDGVKHFSGVAFEITNDK